MPVITAALFARFASRQDESLRGQGHRGAPQPVRRARGRAAREADTPPERDHARRRTRCSRACGCGARPDPCALVIFGASGDLTQRKLFPALYSLAYRRLLPGASSPSSASRAREQTDDEFRERDEGGGAGVRARRRSATDVWERLADGMRYVADRLRRRRGRGRARRAARRARRGARDARQPRLLPRRPAERDRDDRRASSASGATAKGWTRLIIEKPFGHDLASAQELRRAPAAVLRPRTRSSASTTTSARRRSRTCWRCGSRTASSSRSGTASSSTTCRSPSPRRSASRSRAGFYEQAGAIRDIFQNHLLQLLALTAMEPPIDFTADAVRNEKVKVLRVDAHARAEVGRARAVRARLRRGRGGARLPRGAGRRPRLDDRDVRRREALRRQLALGRHAVLRPRTGKRLARRETTIAIQFKRAPHPPFEELAGGGAAAERARSSTCSRTRASRSRSARRCRGRG